MSAQPFSSVDPSVDPPPAHPVPALRARLGLPLLLLLGGVGCRGRPGTIFAELDRARQLALSLRLQLDRANDASNRAVMADTDEQSIAYARDAEQATEQVQRDTTALHTLLERLGFAEELRSLREFQRGFAKYRSLEQTILALAVENTNLKAQALAFGPTQQAADAFRDASAELAATISGKSECRGEALGAQATLCVREIQVLLAPHIAEASEVRMAAMEQDMARLTKRAGQQLQALGELCATKEPTTLARATAALARFGELCAQIVALSRKNSNVRSLQLALRDKPPLVGDCDASLQRLERALAVEGSKATR